MAKLAAKIIQSTIYPGEVSIRGDDGQSNVRYLLTKAGFQPNEDIIIISKDEYIQLVRQILVRQIEVTKAIDLKN
jgi:hypothetical protein